MNYQEAKLIIESRHKQGAFDVQRAYGFIDGWNARMEYEAELNGKPKEPYVHENGIEDN